MRWPLVLQSRSGFTTTPPPLNWIKETKKRPLQISISPYSWVSHCNRLDWWASSTEPCGFWLISSFIVVFCFYVFQIKTISAMLFQLQCDNSSEATSWFDSIGTIIRRLVSSQRVFLEFFECFFFFLTCLKCSVLISAILWQDHFFLTKAFQAIPFAQHLDLSPKMALVALAL